MEWFCLLVVGFLAFLAGIITIGLVVTGDVVDHEKTWGIIAFVCVLGGAILCIFEIVNILKYIF